MPKVSVSEEIIASIMTVLQNARGGLEEAVVDLRRAYFQAGVDWNDKKYSQLGDIVEHASRSILVIGSHLGSAKEKVKKLQQAIIDYINTGAARSSSNPSAYIRTEQKTQQCISNMTINERDAKVFDHPTQLADKLHSSQGNNSFNMGGTCSLVVKHFYGYSIIR